MAVRVSTSKRKIRVITTVPAARMEAGKILWFIKKSKAVNTCSMTQALSISTVGTMAPFSIRAGKIASVKTEVKGTVGDQRLTVMLVG